MKIIDCRQGEPEWHAARVGLPTASAFHRLMTEKTRRLGSGAETYMRELLAEWLLGVPLGPDAGGFMERGVDMEASAVLYYEVQRDIATQRVGLCVTDDGRVGASPDRLVGSDGLLEIKVPSAAVHVGHLLDTTLAGAHMAQVQGQLWITGRSWADILSFHPELPVALVRVPRDQDYIKDLASCVNQFCENLENAKAKLIRMGVEPLPAPNMEAALA